MSAGTARQLLADRASRDAARAVFDSRLEQIRSDLDARGVGGRIADRLGGDARNVMEEAVEIADSHRGIIAGTFAAVALWIFRDPIMAGIDRLMGGEEQGGQDEQD